MYGQLSAAGSVTPNPQRESQVQEELVRQTNLLTELHGVLDQLEQRLVYVLLQNLPSGNELAKEAENKVGLASQLSANNGGINAAINKVGGIIQRLEV